MRSRATSFGGRSGGITRFIFFPLQRLAAIQNTQHDETTEGQFANGGRLVDNVEANRLQIFFPGDSLGIDPPRTQA